MGIKTEDFVKNLPPKDKITPGVDWLGILDSFDPSTIGEKYLAECARRNPYDTCYGWDTPGRPVEERLKEAEGSYRLEKKELEKCVRRIETEGLTSTTYKQAHAALLRTIGLKGAVEYNRIEFERLGEAGREEQKAEYEAWKRDWEKQAVEDEYLGWESGPASLHEKIVRIRKGIKASNGRPLTQRDFARFIEYPVSKYAEAEKIEYCTTRESVVEEELLYKLIMICHANPYWLFDSECDAEWANYDRNDRAVLIGDEPCVYAPVDVILKWILEGKPNNTCRVDGA